LWLPVGRKVKAIGQQALCASPDRVGIGGRWDAACRAHRFRAAGSPRIDRVARIFPGTRLLRNLCPVVVHSDAACGPLGFVPRGGARQDCASHTCQKPACMRHPASGFGVSRLWLGGQCIQPFRSSCFQAARTCSALNVLALRGFQSRTCAMAVSGSVARGGPSGPPLCASQCTVASNSMP